LLLNLVTGANVFEKMPAKKSEWKSILDPFETLDGTVKDTYWTRTGEFTVVRSDESQGSGVKPPKTFPCVSKMSVCVFAWPSHRL
jgi:hypothetical protein